jgi:hypothetical protein
MHMMSPCTLTHQPVKYLPMRAAFVMGTLHLQCKSHPAASEMCPTHATGMYAVNLVCVIMYSMYCYFYFMIPGAMIQSL